MVCFCPVPFYVPPSIFGLKTAASAGDGYSVVLNWVEAFPSSSYKLFYNLYYSTERENVFSEGPKYLSLNLEGLCERVGNLKPGDVYYFAVRASNTDISWFNPNFLPDAASATNDQGSKTDGYLKYYPESFLLEDISSEQMVIPMGDLDSFPAYGVILVGFEYIRYSSVDLVNSSIIVEERGFQGTEPREHTVDGYDGYGFRDPIIHFYKGCEEQNNLVYQEEVKFEGSNNAYTLSDGYRFQDDLVTIDPDRVEPDREEFDPYCYSGWRRTDPALLFKGECLDTYINRVECCIDGYDNVFGTGGASINVSVKDISDKHNELILEQTGEPVVLFRRMYSGINCSCYEQNKESPEYRCPKCFGTGFINGYTPYYSPRRGDGKILVRFEPAVEDIKVTEAGLESEIIPNCWTLAAPIVNDRDFLIRFDDNGNEEFRYVIKNVTRNRLFYGQSGKQNFSVQRVRRTDPIYQVRSLRDDYMFPLDTTTNVGTLRGPNNAPIPHTHTIRITENDIVLTDVDLTTGETLGHTHQINPNSLSAGIGETEVSLGHSHKFTL